MNNPSQSDRMARLAMLLDSESDLDTPEARALAVEAGLSFDDLLELRETADAAEYAGLLEATLQTDETGGDPDADRVTEALLALAKDAPAQAADDDATERAAKAWVSRRWVSRPWLSRPWLSRPWLSRRWAGAWVALAAAVALMVLVSRREPANDRGPIDGRATLGPNQGDESVYLDSASKSIDLPIALGIGDTLTVTIEARRASAEWWPLLERTIDRPELTLRDDEVLAIQGAEEARIRWVRRSADGSRFSPPSRPLERAQAAPR